jgi:hypothetical protein
MAAMSALEVQSYLAKAEDFLDSVKLLADSTDHRISMALLAVHCAISFGDALWVGLGNERLAATNHRSRRSELLGALNRIQYNDVHGLKHLDTLISNKTRIAYSADLLTGKMAADMAIHAIRFSKWANQTGAALNIEGWR